MGFHFSVLTASILRISVIQRETSRAQDRFKVCSFINLVQYVKPLVGTNHFKIRDIPHTHQAQIQKGDL